MDSKAERRAAREMLGAYHEAELQKLIERLRAELARFDAGEIDAFEFDALVHRYHRAAQRLWSLCAVTGLQSLRAARTLEMWREDGDLPDWWAEAEPRRRT